MELLSPKNDFVFKRIFGSEDNTDILLNLLNATLRLPTHKQLTELELLNPILDKQHIDDKFSILDIRARTADGEQINVEIQMFNEANMEMRTLFYWAKMFTEQMSKGDEYVKLKKTITINILNFRYLRGTDKYHSVFHLREDETGEVLTDLLEIHFVELPKFQLESAQNDPLGKWVLFLEGISVENMEGLGMNEPEVLKAYQILQLLSHDPETRMMYEAREKALRDKQWILNLAARNEEKGREEGRREGRQELLKATQNNICFLVEAKFGADSLPMQQIVQQVTEQEALDRAFRAIATINTLEEAKRVLQDVLKKDF